MGSSGPRTPGLRWQGLAGVAGLAMVSVALALPGPPPKAADSARSLTTLLTQHRSAFVSGTLLTCFGLVALLWFVGVLATTVRQKEPPDSPRAAIVLVAGAAGSLLMFVGMVLFSGVAFKAAALGDQAIVRAFVDTGNMLIEASKFGFGVLVFAACSADDVVPRRVAMVGRMAAALLVLSALPPFLTDHGIGQFGGVIDLGGTVPAFAWLAALSIALVRSPSPRGERALARASA